MTCNHVTWLAGLISADGCPSQFITVKLTHLIHKVTLKLFKWYRECAHAQGHTFSYAIGKFTVSFLWSDI
jgi:hypothetical protein